MNDYLKDLPTTFSRDFFRLFIGEAIGNGMSRHVYQHAQDKDVVIKVEGSAGYFQNIVEWEIWKQVEGTVMQKWFAPCIDISPNGIFLLQKKVEVIPHSSYPKEVPDCFQDFKYQNFGRYNKRFVCCDYGNLVGKKIFTEKFRKVKWSDFK